MSSSPPTAFYLVRGEGVRDNEWHLSSPEPLTYSNLPSNQSFRVLDIPSNSKTALPPIVRIFPPQAVPNFFPPQNPSPPPHSNQSFAANASNPTSTPVPAPVAVPAASHSFISAQTPPRQHSFTGATMIARPRPEPTIESPSVPSPNPTSPLTSNLPSSQPLLTRNLSKSKAHSSLQAKPPSTAASDAAQTAALKNVVDDIRDRKKRIVPSKNLPPLPKLQEKPPSTPTSVSLAELQQEPRREVVVHTDRDTSGDHHADKSVKKFTVPVKKELAVGTPDHITQSGAGTDGMTGGDYGADRVRERKQAHANARPQDRSNEEQAKKSFAQNGDVHEQASKHSKRGANTTMLASTAGRADADTHGAKEINVAANVASKAPSVTHGKGMNKVNLKKGEGVKPVETALPEASKNGAVASPRALNSQHNLLPELRSESLGRCIRLLAQLVALCNIQNAVSAEKSKQLRGELRAVVGLAPISSPSEVTIPSANEGKEKLKSNAKQRRVDSQAPNPESKDSADLIAQAKSDLRGVRFKFLRWRMLISKSNARLQDIATDCRQIVGICDAFSKSQKGPAISDRELLEHISDLDIGSGTVKYLFEKMKSYLQSIESDDGDHLENLEGLKLSTSALKDILRWILYLTEQVYALWLRCIELPKESNDVLKFCTVIGKMVTTSRQQANSEGDGIIFVLREMKKSFPTSKEFPANGAGDGKPYFSWRRKIGDDRASILPMLASVGTWALNQFKEKKVKSADGENTEEANLHGETARAVDEGASTSDPVREDSQKQSDGSVLREAGFTENDGESAQKKNMLSGSKDKNGESVPRHPLPSGDGHYAGKRGANEVDSNSKPSGAAKGPEESSFAIARGQERSPDAYAIPRRGNKKSDEHRDIARPSTSRSVGNAMQSPVRSDSNRLDNAALVRARLANGSLAGKRKREDTPRESGVGQSGKEEGGERKIACGNEMNGNNATDADGRRKKKKKKGLRVSFAPQLIAGSIETVHKKEELEFVFHDGYDLLGCRNGMQEEAVRERANQLQRGAVVALLGYLRAEFLRLKHEAETTLTEPTPTLVDLRLTPPALRQIERRLPADQISNLPRTD